MNKPTIIICIAALLTVCGNASLWGGKGFAVYPIYDVAQECLLGAWTEDGWIGPDSAAQYLYGGEKYALYSMFRPYGYINGQKPHNSEMGACPEMLTIDLDSIAVEEERVFAFTGEWNALPRAPDTIKSNKRTDAIVKSFLKKNGIKNPKVNVTSVYLIDIDGKGQKDTVISAAYISSKSIFSPKKGDYSIVILQRNVDGRPVTIPLATDIHTKSDGSLMYQNVVLGFFDFNNDSKLEILINESYYEGSFSILSGIENNEYAHYLDCGCGL